MTELKEIPGMHEDFAIQLKRVGADSVERLLEKGSTRGGRRQIIDETMIDPKLVTSWISQADLLRIPGVRGPEAALLEASGVATVSDLAREEASTLVDRLSEVNRQKRLAEQIPSESDLERWIQHADEAPRVLEPNLLRQLT